MTVTTRRQLSRRTVCGREPRARVSETLSAGESSPTTPTGSSATHLDTLRVHLVVLLGASPVQAGVPLLADEEVGEVDLLELELDRLDELGRDKVGGLGTCATRGESQARKKKRSGKGRKDAPSFIAVSRSGQPNRTMTESVSP